MSIPGLLLRELYSIGSLRNENGGVTLSLRNSLADAELVAVRELRLDGEPVPLSAVLLRAGAGEPVAADRVSDGAPLAFPLRGSLRVSIERAPLAPGLHRLAFDLESRPAGRLRFEVADALEGEDPIEERIPRDPDDDYSPGAVRSRQAWVEEYTGGRMDHLARFSIDPHAARGHCEHFTGAAQVPVGFAGPLRVDGEHARGEFLVPLATSEGTLVASYNRGMQVLNLSGGVRCTVVGDAMQRAPAFVFESAREGRDFVAWVQENTDEIRRRAEATSDVARLTSIEPYQASRFVYLRFNFTTRDAAGQNTVTRATFAACGWMAERFPGVRRFYLEANMATDKKSSHINLMRTRGKRVTAEATIPRDVLVRRMRVEPRALAQHYGVAGLGAMLAGSHNNGLHAANAIAAVFIATGQDVANVAESAAGLLYTEVTPGGDLYISITLPALIVATHGGGTGLPTQRECLELMGCLGAGKVNKFAEIVAGAVLAGEVSLASAISALEWVSAHEQMGRHF